MLSCFKRLLVIPFLCNTIFNVEELLIRFYFILLVPHRRGVVGRRGGVVGHFQQIFTTIHYQTDVPFDGVILYRKYPVFLLSFLGRRCHLPSIFILKDYQMDVPFDGCFLYIKTP